MARIDLREDLSRIPPLDPRLAYIKNCTRCSLSPFLGQNPTCKQVVVGSGNLQSRVLLVFAVPAKVENEYGWPVIGASNEVFDWLECFGIRRYEDWFCTNAAMCMLPPDRDGMDVKQKELDACRHNLSQIIDLMPNLKIILWFGQPAAIQTEGRAVTVSARLFNVGKIPEWVPSGHHFQKGRSFLTYGLWHPAFILRKQGKEREYYEKKYRAALSFISEIIHKHLDDIEQFEYPRNYITAWEPKVALDWAEKQLKDNRVKHYTIDYETLGRVGFFNRPIGVAFSYENPDTQQIECFWTFFLKREFLPKSEWKRMRMGKHKGHFTLKYKWTPWHYDSFAQDFMNIMRGLLDSDGYRPAGREKPQISAWNNGGFEMSVTKGEFGYDLCGSDRQMSLEAYHDDVEPFDPMAAFRQVSNGNSLALARVLEMCFPLLALEKEPAHELIKSHWGEHSLDTSGYGMLAAKLPDHISKEEIYEKGQIYVEWLAELKHETKKKVKKDVKKSCPLSEEWLVLVEDFYSPEYRKLFCEVLAERAQGDTFMEKLVIQTWHNLVNSPNEWAEMSVARKDFDLEFFDDRYVQYFGETNELDFAPVF